MCMEIIKSMSAPKVPRIFYKVVIDTSSERCSPYYQMSFDKGKVVKAHGDLDIYSGYRRQAFVAGGAIHVYTHRYCRSLMHALDSLSLKMPGDWWSEHDKPVVIRVRCLPEHFVAWGKGMTAAYTQVEVLD